MKFFLDAGIPPDSSAQYAVTFETNRMGLDMLMDLDKEYLRDLNITALGDIISILKHSKSASAKKAADKVLHSDIESDKPKSCTDKANTIVTESAKTSTSIKSIIKSEKKVDTKSRKESSAVSRLGPHVSTDTIGPVCETAKSVFSRLGDQESEESEGDSKRTNAISVETSPGSSKSIFERLGPESLMVVRDPSTQEARVTSTTEIVLTQPARGILKKRGTGDGSGLAKSKSASNIISLKAPTFKDLKKKRISFGENEIKTIEPKPDIKSRLGYGKCNSPPPPEISEPTLKTEIKKIAVGGGKFEMKKVMKVVNADATIASELGRSTSSGLFSQEQELNSHRIDKLTIAVKNDLAFPISDVKPIKIAIKSDHKVEEEYAEYKVDKVDLALRAAKLKVQRIQARDLERNNDYKPREVKSEEPSHSKKRLAKYVTKPDGTVVKEYIGYDDPILETLPIKKKKSQDLTNMISKTEDLNLKSLPNIPIPLIINKNRFATNFQVVRPSSTQPSLYSDLSHVTLAQKAVLARSKGETFQTLASRARESKKRSVSPELGLEKSARASVAKMDEKKPSLKTRLEDGNRFIEEIHSLPKSPLKSVRDRVMSGDSSVSVKDRVGSRDRSPASMRDRITSRDRSPASMRDRVGSRDRSPLSIRDRVGSRDRERSPVQKPGERLGSAGEKKIFSRLGPRD